MENKRQKLVWLIFAIFAAIVFEGALRKWVFPDYQQYFFFIRDPFVIIAYLYALHAGLTPKKGSLLYLVLAFTIIITLFSFFQTLYSHLPWWIIGYSWRTHFLMLPLSLIIGSFLKTEDMIKIAKYSLRITPVYLVIAYYQSILPYDHWINGGVLGLFKPLTASNGLVRTEGLFTSSVGNALFVAFLIAAILAIWLKDDWACACSKIEKYAYTVLVSTIVILSGQRTTFLLAGLILVVNIVSSIIAGRNMTIKAFKPVVAMCFAAALLLLVIFPQHYAAITNRFIGSGLENSAVGLDIAGRVYEDLTNFYKEFALKIPEAGLGIGYSSNAAQMYNLTVIDIYSENEWGRHIIELGPFFGFLMIVFRVFLFLYLLIMSLHVTIYQKSPVAMLFFAGLAPFLLFGQLTGNGIASGMVWFMTGVVLAIINEEQNKYVSTDCIHKMA
jgi:hypothetical protein